MDPTTPLLWEFSMRGIINYQLPIGKGTRTQAASLYAEAAIQLSLKTAQNAGLIDSRLNGCFPRIFAKGFFASLQKADTHESHLCEFLPCDSKDSAENKSTAHCSLAAPSLALAGEVTPVRPSATTVITSG